VKNRIYSLKSAFKKKVDGYILIDKTNIFYLTDFSGAAAMLVPREGESVLYVYSVNYGAARAEAKNCRVEMVKSGEGFIKKIEDQIRSQKLKNLGFDTMKVQTHHKLSKTLKNAQLEARSEYVSNIRRVKDEGELRKMQKAADLTAKGMQTAYETIKTGLREYEVAAEIEYTMRTHGSSGVAFNTIVASGPNSAYPHGGWGERKLRIGDLVVIDIGATYKNYRGDMSRTFVIGKPSAKQERIYALVKTAQEQAFQKMRDGAKASEIDCVARNLIAKEGYSEYFVHSLGHGIGLETHEQPFLSPTSKDVIGAGNVVTDEPGVYIIGFGGFRIEDTVLIRKDDGKRMTKGHYVLKAS